MTSGTETGTLIWLEQRAVRLTNGLTVVGFAALLLLALAQCADITGRYAFNRPLHGVGDVAAAVMAVIVLAAFPACFAGRRNIAIDMLGQALGERVRRWLEVLGHVTALVFMTLIAWQLVKYAGDIQHSGQTTWVLRWPLAPWWWAAAALAVLTVPVQLIVTLRGIADAVSGVPAAGASVEDEARHA